ncbi:MAG: hypothetical protein ACOCQ5_01480 [Halanaerobiales bacterium]
MTGGKYTKLKEKELERINGGFRSTGELIGYYARKARKVLDLSRSGFRSVLIRRKYYH